MRADSFAQLFFCMQMITKNFEDYPEHRLKFFSLLRAIATYCFPALVQLSSEVGAYYGLAFSFLHLVLRELLALSRLIWFNGIPELFPFLCLSSATEASDGFSYLGV